MQVVHKDASPSTHLLTINMTPIIVKKEPLIQPAPMKRSSSSGETHEMKRHDSHHAGHRPVTSCTHCRQHKIKCNASERYPKPCQRCERMSLNCEIDPQFRPKKGSQIQALKQDVDELRTKIDFLSRNENLIARALSNGIPRQSSIQATPERQPAVTVLETNNSPVTSESYKESSLAESFNENSLVDREIFSEFSLGEVTISLEQAKKLHSRFMVSYLPFIPIMSSRNPSELYKQSHLLFWTVMLTSCLSDPDPDLYMRLSSSIKQLAIETCWIRTPRSTHIVQALLILSMWPLPNRKVLDDCSYRFVGLAKNLSLQLGLHRGEFMWEFSRTQVSLPDAEKYRTRTWISVFFMEQFWSSALGLPPALQTDFLLENARIDSSLPKGFRCLISLAIFQSKLVNMMGLSVTSPDGLMEPKNRAGSLAILERELERLNFKLQIDSPSVEIYYLYIKLMVCVFAFLPETPTEDQTKYVTQAYLTATRIITIISKMSETRQLIELPIFIRHSVTYAALVLFRLHLTPFLLPKYVDSARQSVVTVHRLFRNMLAAWKDIENDISRTATVLEKLNFVVITHPELFTKAEGIITRMRSHLTGSLFYDLVWCIHEARRRVAEAGGSKSKLKDENPLPLPFYNQITKDDFNAITTTTPNGTTVTTLVPTDQAMNNATADATAAGLTKPLQINGIPMAMLEATGSVSGVTNTPTVDEPAESLMVQPEEYAFDGVPSNQTGNGNNGFIDSIFQQEKWMENDDDFLGWFDVNAPSF